MEDGDVFDFRGMRLDWFRLQVRSHQENETSFAAGAGRQTWVQIVFEILSQYFLCSIELAWCNGTTIIVSKVSKPAHLALQAG